MASENLQTVPSSQVPTTSPEVTLERKPATAEAAEVARSESVSALLEQAYLKASDLKLTPEESKALRAPFAPDMFRRGAKGEDNLIYLCHIHVSDRLNDVLGIGQWALVKRGVRAEKWQTKDGKPLVRVYFEGVLLIRGAFVAEAIGSGQYHPNNAKEDYGTALEISMSDCLRRCAKRLGIGSQAWDKGFCDTWLAEHGGAPRAPISEPRANTDPAPPPKTPFPDAPPPDGDIVTGILQDVSSRSGETDGKPWTLYGLLVAGEREWIKTFDRDIYDAALGLKGQNVVVTYVRSGKFKDATAIRPA